MAEKRDSLIFYRSFYEAIKELPVEVQADVYNAIFEYGLNFNEVVLTGLPKSIFILIKPQLEANIKKFENGKRPKNKQTISKIEANDKQSESKQEGNANVNDNVNVNDNANENVNTDAHPLKNSNLFRQPKIPTKEEVRRAFFSAGGTEEQAARFFDKYNAVGWFLNGSPIVNFKTLLPSYISNWAENEKNKKNGTDKRTPEKYSNPKTAGAERALDQLKDILSSTGFGAANPES